MTASEYSQGHSTPRGDLPLDQAALSSDQQPPLILTEEGRQRLYNEWLARRLSEGKIDQKKLYTPEERSAFLADWLRTLITQGQLDPHRRLPPYRSLEDLPFNLRKKEIARVIAQLRSEGLLPSRRDRIDKGRPQWTERDLACMRWIGQMRAIRYDQLQRLLARHSAYERSDPQRLSVWRTSRIIGRWVRANYALYRRVYANQPGWIYLSKKGLEHIGLPFRAEAPKDRVLEHIYYINEVRLALEEQDSSLRWIGERAIQAAQKQRKKGQRLQHIPDGIVVSGARRIDIEVQISHPLQQEAELILRGDRWQSANPLRYYVSKEAKAVVQRAYREVKKFTARPEIEIIELEAFLQSSAEGTIT
jgi:hypothetical protein